MGTVRHSFSDLIDVANIRKLTQKTVSTYPIPWIVIHEALQNAKDAIQRGPRERGTITVTLDLAEQKVSVKDDGAGFPHNKSLLGLGGTDKDTDGVDTLRIHGNQGVGLKVVIFSTIKFRIESVVNGQKWQAWVDNAKTYFDGADVQINITDPVETPEDSGTLVEYQFDSPFVVEFLEAIYAQYFNLVHDDIAPLPLSKLITAIEYYFRSYSYAGDVNRLIGDPVSKPIEINIDFRCDPQRKPNGIMDNLWSILSANPSLRIRFENKHWDLAEFIDRIQRGRPKPHVLADVPLASGGDIGRRSDNYIWVGKLSTSRDFAKLLDNDRLRTPIIPQQHQGLLERVQSIYVAVGSRSVLQKFLLETPRQFVAASGVPSAHSLQTPTRGEEASYVTNNIHFILNLKEKLNYGKQTITNTRLLGMANRFFADAVRATLRNVARSIVGNILGSSTGDDLDSLISQETNILGREDIGLPNFSFVKVPHDENALIGIFYELIGRGHLDGVRTYSLHRKTTYDGRAVLRDESHEDFPPVGSDNELKYIEFKLKLSGLVYDFEEGIKSSNLVTLGSSGKTICLPTIRISR